MATELQGKRIAFLVAPKGTEHDELVKPMEAAKEAGAETVLVSSEAGTVTTNRKDLEPGEELRAELGSADVKADDFDAVVIPGGTVGADKLRADEKLVSFVRSFVEQGKPVASICHGPQLLVETGALRGRRMTSYASVKTDMKNAGAVEEDLDLDTGQWVYRVQEQDMVGTPATLTLDERQALLGAHGVDDLEDSLLEVLTDTLALHRSRVRTIERLLVERELERQRARLVRSDPVTQ